MHARLHNMKKLHSVPVAAALSLVLSLAYVVLPAQAANSNLELDLMSKASPDECFIEIGNNQPISGDECDEGMEKTNQAYVWGMTVANDRVWFGTGSNVNCLVTGTFLQSTGSSVRDWGDQTDYVCELADGQNSSLPDSLKDWRSPALYVQGINSPNPVSLIPRMSTVGQQLAAVTVGFRAAGSIGDLVYFGGPSLMGGINLFAFDSSDGSFLAAKNLPGYSNIRTLKPYEDVMVAGVSSSTGGATLVFDGGKADPLSETVALETTAGEIAEFEFYENRMYFGTWPKAGSDSVTEASVRVGPEISPDLDFGSDDDYEILWTASDYDPDPIIATTYGIGSMKFFDGELYFGTMHVPFVSLGAISAFYEDSLDDITDVTGGQLTLFLGSLRSSALFAYDPENRVGDDLGDPRTLYGNPVLPLFAKDVDGTLGLFLEPNPQSELPEYGLSGFNNPFNNYIWDMSEFDDKLYIGTMDWSYLFVPPLGDIGDPEENQLAGPEYFNLSLLLEDTFDQFQIQIDIFEEAILDPGELSDLEDINDFLFDTVYPLLSAIVGTGLIADPALEDEIESILERIDDFDDYLTDIGASPTEEQLTTGFATAQGILVDLGEVLLEIEDELLVASDEIEPLRYGADVMVFDKNDTPAEFLSNEGLGNHLNYGIRTMDSHSSEGVFFGTANPMNLQAEGGWELYNLGPSSQMFSAPNPFQGPVITDVGADGINADFTAQAGNMVSIRGTNLEAVTEVEIAGMKMMPEQISGSSFEISLPVDIEAGLHQLTVYAGSQKILVQERINIPLKVAGFDICAEQGPRLWTKRLSDSESKVYIKCAEVGVKYQVLAQTNGSGSYEEIFWTRLEDINDESQRFAGESRYFVRSVDIEQKLRLRLIENGQVVNQVVYNN